MYIIILWQDMPTFCAGIFDKPVHV